MKDNYSKNKHCPNCGKLITNYSTKCKSCWQKGSHLSKQHRKNLSLNHANFKGKNHPMFGKHHTKTAIQKIKLNHVDSSGKNNGMYGRKLTKSEKLKISIATRKAMNNAIVRMKCSNKGKNHPNYKHGLGHLPYTKEFTVKLKRYIHKRDNYACQYCGMTQEEHFEKYGKNIEVHHIDYNKFNCKEDNLITLCTKCNIRANFNIDYWHALYMYIMEENILCQV